jgi:nicotinate-nucleotide adenylyltransferase
MRRIGLMGGTFDPVHVGHLAIAERARAELGLDEVVFVPAGRPWQKQAVAPAEDRCEMVRLAVAGRAGFRVSRIEVDRGGPTYTVDTLRELRAQEPGAEWWLIAGADSLAGLATWREPDEVARLARFAVVGRAGSSVDPPAVAGLSLTVVPMEEIALSSTDIRARLRRGEGVEGLLTPEVAAYIRARGL